MVQKHRRQDRTFEFAVQKGWLDARWLEADPEIRLLADQPRLASLAAGFRESTLRA